jgi:hypothetical protein
MTKDEIIKALRDMAKYPTVTFPRDCEALRAAADLLAQPAPYMAVSNDRMTIDPHTGNVSIGTPPQEKYTYGTPLLDAMTGKKEQT